MKLLPRKIDIDKAKASERKREIDEGVKLATSIDKLRQQLSIEKKNLEDWRASNIAKVQQEIDSYLEVKENLRIETEKQEAYRKKLIEPLDKEWAEVNVIKKKTEEERFSLGLSREIIDTQFKDIEKEKSRLSEIIVKQKQNEKDTEKAKQEITSLKELAQKEYEMAREEHIAQSDRHEKKMIELSQREREYEVAQNVIKVRENEVKEKESELLLREQHLASQQVALRVASEALKQNGRS